MLGSSIGKADSLSRWPDWQKEVEKDNENRILLRKEWLKVRVTQLAKIVIEEVDILEKIKKSEAKNNKMVKVVEEMKWTGVKNTKRWGVERRR